MSKTNIFVVGGAGYVGAHTVKELARVGYNPIVLDNFSTGHKSFCKWGEKFEVDIMNKTDLEKLFLRHKPSAVMHFAAHAYVGESVTDPKKYYSNNIIGTLNLLEVMLNCDVKKFIFSSSCAVYGIPSVVPITESEEKKPINPYGFTKLAIERALSDYEVAYDFRSVCLRYFNAAGADPAGEIGESHNPETHLIPLVLEAAAGTRDKITVFGNDYQTKDGTCVRDYIHVSDLAKAHVAALKHLDGNKKSLSVNLGTGKGYSVKEVLASAERVTGKPIKVEYGLRRPGDPPTLVADPGMAKEVLGWHAEYKDIDVVIKHAWNWLNKK